jgi:hypothetical protein
MDENDDRHDIEAEMYEIHKDELSACVRLSAAASTPQSLGELARLRPGDPLCMKERVDLELNCYDVFSCGNCIGHLLLSDAERVNEIAKNGHITGTYVCDNDPLSPSSLHVIVFYRPESHSTARPVSGLTFSQN